MTQLQPATHAVSWQQATVEQIVVETHRVKSFTLRLPKWTRYKPGQHVDVRLTAPDGYQAQRSYSIASAPENEGVIDLTIELIADGEVSPFFHEIVQPGDEIEVRGPIGGPFTWTAALGGPLLLVGGGSGVVPLMSMLRHRANTAPEVPALLLYSSRSVDEVIYREQLDRYAASNPKLTVVHTLTRAQPSGWNGYTRRVDQEMLADVMRRIGEPSHVYVCGPTGFVEAVADELVALDVPPAIIRTERFGPSGT
ncbi:MAG: ferredoxin reductase [Acidiferrobacterales bacterium]